MRFIDKTYCKLSVTNGSVKFPYKIKSIFIREILLLSLPVLVE